MGKITEIRWHGRGGQGVVTASILLARSALREGKYCQAFPEFGPERMGAPIRAFTRISESPIKIHSHVNSPGIVISLDPTLIGSVNISEGLAEDGVLIVNYSGEPAEVEKHTNIDRERIYTVDATRIALDTIGRNIPNTPLIAALIRATGLIRLDTLIEEIEASFGAKFSRKVIDANISAVKRAYDEVKH